MPSNKTPRERIEPSGIVVIVREWDDACKRMLYEWVGDGNFVVMSREMWEREHRPCKLILCCGEGTVPHSFGNNWRARIIEMLHPNDNRWTPYAVALAGRFIREGQIDLELYLRDGHLVAEQLVPF